MALLYKTFHSVRIALAAAFLFVCVHAYPASAAPDLYTVSNINVDVTADNALKAREQAFEQAQIKAFEELAGRILPESRFAAFQAPPAQTISMLIQDYELSDEKLAAKRYIGTYVFRFRRSAVDKYLGLGAGAPQAMNDPYAPYSQQNPQYPQNPAQPTVPYGQSQSQPMPYEAQAPVVTNTPVYPYPPAPEAPYRASGSAQTYAVHVRFTSLSEWTRVQRSLANVSGMQDIALKALSPRDAYLDLNYRGDVRSFQGALGQAGLSLVRSTNGKFYEISSLSGSAAPPSGGYSTQF